MKERTYTKLLSDARLSCCCCCCCCCVCWCCCCCCGCWEIACCCHDVGNKPPGDARACKAVMSALVSWYSESVKDKRTKTTELLISHLAKSACSLPELVQDVELTCVVRCGHGGEGQPLCQEARCGYGDHRRGEGLCHLGSGRQPLGVLPERSMTC